MSNFYSLTKAIYLIVLREGEEGEMETIVEEPVAIPTNTIEVTNPAGMYI